MSESVKSSKISELSKMLMRKFRSIKYENVILPPEYLKAEDEYKAVRECLRMLENSIIKNLKNYEHGNKMYKNLKKGMQFLSDKASLDLYRNTDIYEDVAVLGDNMMEINEDSKYKSIGKKCKDAFSAVSDSKKSFNDKMGELSKRIKKMKETTHAVDSMRKKVKNTRYDLEVIFQDGGYQNEIKETEEANFKKLMEKTQAMMEDFVDTNDMPRMLKDMSVEYKTHLEASVQALKFIG